MWWKSPVSPSSSHPILRFPMLTNILTWVLSFSFSIQYCIFKNILWVLFLNFVYKNAVCIIFQLASFTQHFISESHPWSRLWGPSSRFHCYEALHWMSVAQCIFIQSLSMNLEVFSVFWNYKQCWFEDLVFVPWGTGIKDSLEWVPKNKICWVVGYVLFNFTISCHPNNSKNNKLIYNYYTIYTVTSSLWVLITSYSCQLLVWFGFKISANLVGLKWHMNLYPLLIFLLAWLSYFYWCIRALLYILDVCVKFLLACGLYIFFLLYLSKW